MRKIVYIIMCMCLVLGLTSCAIYPTTADDGAPWDKSWEMMGQVLGVEAPGGGFELLENDSVLTGQDTYYATWAVGEPTAFVNADGKDTDLYEAQIYLIVFGCKDAATADRAVGEWLDSERTSYDVKSEDQVTCNGQDYTFLKYLVTSDTNPFHRGASAFTVYDTYAVSAELSCVEGYTGDEEALLKSFLEGCHYSSDLLK